MHRSYQPLKPVTNRFLQQRWDQNDYDNHRRKVNTALPVVDNKGTKTPAHIQLKLKKIQLQDERLSIIDRDNRLLASKLAAIVRSQGLVDHHNHYHLRSLNADKRREELLLVSRQNQDIYHRITARQSEYRRQLWLDDWERTERRRDDISRYPPGLAQKQRSHRKVKFAAVDSSERSTSCSTTDTDRTDRET
ncbi:sperm axonemal maintenance protein CFAP97D1 [Halichoeres trimaculatus]|uniref:sperm axonemal maintenance protein CFAP97D1 n=1 Tax=Halichoeres trimaculatus TaxID=147232 RepID=UPI003D9DFC14